MNKAILEKEINGITYQFHFQEEDPFAQMAIVALTKSIKSKSIVLREGEFRTFKGMRQSGLFHVDDPSIISYHPIHILRIKDQKPVEIIEPDWA